MVDKHERFDRNWDPTAKDLIHEADRILSRANGQIASEDEYYEPSLRVQNTQSEMAFFLTRLLEKVITLTEELSEAKEDLQELQNCTTTRSKHFERDQWIYDNVIGSADTHGEISFKLKTIAPGNNWNPVSERRIGQIAVEHAKRYNLKRPEPRKESVR